MRCTEFVNSLESVLSVLIHRLKIFFFLQNSNKLFFLIIIGMHTKRDTYEIKLIGDM